MKKIRVIKIAPREIPDIAFIYPTREAILTALGGSDNMEESVYLKKLDDNIYAVCLSFVNSHEIEGNRKINGKIICGTFFVVETDSKGKLVGMSDENFKKYVNRFFMPESYSDDESLDAYLKIDL